MSHQHNFYDFRPHSMNKQINQLELAEVTKPDSYSDSESDSETSLSVTRKHFACIDFLWQATSRIRRSRKDWNRQIMQNHLVELLDPTLWVPSLAPSSS